MSLRGSLASISFDAKTYQAYFDKQMVEILKSSIRVWLAVAVSKIPVWSGMSRATLLKLADQVGYQIAIFPVVKIDHTGRLRVAGDGRSEGRENSKGELFTTFPKYGFYWESTVPRLNTNEEHNVNEKGWHLITPGAYHFRLAADEAFTRAVREQITRFKYNIQRGIKVTTRRIR